MPAAQTVTPPPSTATLAVRAFNNNVKHALENPYAYAPGPASDAKLTCRAFFAGTDTFVKKAFDPENSPSVRVVAASLGPAIALAGLGVGVMGTIAFGASFCVASSYWTRTDYSTRKTPHNQRRAIRESLEQLDKNLAPYFKRKIRGLGAPTAAARYDVYALTQELEQAQNLLLSPKAQVLGMRDPNKTVRKYLAAANAVPAPAESPDGTR